MSRTASPLGLLVLLTLLAACGDKQATEDDEPKPPDLVTQTVAYEHDGVALEGYLAYDANRKGKRPGVLVIHEWWGVDEHPKERARRLAADLPGVFASIAPVAGLLARGALPEATRVSLLHVHGTADRVVAPSGRGGSYGAQEGVRVFAARAGCAAAPIETWVAAAAPLRVRERRYACPFGVDVALLLIEGRGHTWPQEGGWLSGTIWSFFREHPRP